MKNELAGIAGRWLLRVEIASDYLRSRKSIPIDIGCQSWTPSPFSRNLSLMNRNDIIKLPNQNLRQRSKKVTAFDDELKKLIKDMNDATLDWEDHRAHEFGVALAAVQIDRHQKVVVVRNNFDDKSDRTFIVFVNPKIVQKSGTPVVDYEGCLSVPDVYGMVPRYPKVKVRAQDESGKEFTVKAEGFLARVFQHEIDHTNGKLFVDHIKDDFDAFYHLSGEGKLEKVSEEDVKKQSHILW